MSRRQEIRQLLSLTPDEIIQRAGERLIVCDDIDALHQRMAQDIFEEIKIKPTATLILPVGPVGHYPQLADMIIQAGLSLARCTFFFMDEYCDEDDTTTLPPTHPLSFKRIANELFLDKLIAHTDFTPQQAIFPDEKNITHLNTMITTAGGLDTCYGGIGIHGHLAFNEPEANISHLGARKVRLNDYTVTINAIRAQIGGNLVAFPRYAYTLGMQELLSARRLRLYCRNGTSFDWANTVLRLALFGTPGDDYPVTYIRDKNYTIITDHDTLQSPRYIL